MYLELNNEMHLLFTENLQICMAHLPSALPWYQAWLEAATPPWSWQQLLVCAGSLHGTPWQPCHPSVSSGCFCGHSSTGKGPQAEPAARGESAPCLCHASCSLPGSIQMSLRQILPSFWCPDYFFQTPMAISWCFWSAIIFSLFKLKTILFDLEFQNQSWV